MKKFIYFIFFPLFYFTLSANAQEVLNLYVWGGEIPLSVIKSFEKKTKIKVNYATFDSNESLYAKLKTTNDFDVILPSSYFIKKLVHEGTLLKIDKNKIPNIKNINPLFLNKDFDKKNLYSLPFSWGATGMFSNKKYFKPLTNWHQLWQKEFRNTLLLMDDAREVFAIALLSLGYSPNDSNLNHLYQAYKKLKLLNKNIKMITSNTIQGLIIDEDARIGMAWSGDIFKVQQENTNVIIHYPKEGYSLWIDCLAILRNAPHKQQAYQFINFLLRNDISIKSQEAEGMASTNLMAHSHLAAHENINRIIENGVILSDIGAKATKHLLKYWQYFKLNL